MSSRARKRQARKTPASKKQAEGFSLPYTRRNLVFFGAGILTILIGYICLAQPPVDGFMSLTLAPILLVIGYCVLIPVGLLLGKFSPEASDNKDSGDNGGG
ncbi:MAG TPA: hypothetical protein DIU35_16015 [Candidatus Latescibacteria bacterium]|nr:hypothetical protein [Gemmatimonadota bacterium]HCR18984.1 hypothetical protein [Candidatus Latescibacterota bacterium]|tara:strand:- start:695 stop:997 length:303 start_codon:yes stop_codon:yes gene_type:complete